jgi:chromate transport protein ChrA
VRGMFIVAAVVVGPIVLALWLDARLGDRRPSSPIWRMVHAGLAYVVVSLAGRTFATLAHNDAPVGEQAMAVSLLVVPALAYAYACVLWLCRTLAEVSRA